MFRTMCCAALAALCLQPAQADLTDEIDRDFAYLESFYLHLHRNPELSLQEVETSARLALELEALGLDVTTGLGDAWVREKVLRDQGELQDGVGGYGVVGVLENGEGPTVLLRADMDALPVNERTGKAYASTVRDITWTGVESGVMHACAHDIHMTSWVGTARRLVDMKDQWSGTLVMIAQPAEEIGLGAQAMLADGLFERFPKPDYNIALHVSASLPAGKVGYASGWAMANVDSVDIEVKGVGGHGAYPHTTKDPIVIAAHIVTALQSIVSREINPQDPAVITVGSIEAGSKHNIISDKAHLKLTVRSYEDEVRQTLLSGIERIAKGQAMAFGAPEPVITVESDFTPSTFNNPDLAAKASQFLADALGEDKVVELQPVMGGEDFSQYGRTGDNIPGLLFWLGAVDPEKIERAKNGKLQLPSLHSPFFAPEYEPALRTGVEAMTTVAIGLFNEE